MQHDLTPWVHETSKLISTECVAVTKVVGLQTFGEPTYPLCGTAMRERIRHHIALATLLKPVIADGRSCVQALFNVALFKNVCGCMRFLCPDSCKAVSLQFHSNRQKIGIRFGQLHSRSRNFFRDTYQILHMMPDLMGDHISLRKIASCAQLVLHILVEGQVDVNLLIQRTVKWTHCGLRHAASGLHKAIKQDEIRFLVLEPKVLEDSCPNSLG